MNLPPAHSLWVSTLVFGIMYMGSPGKDMKMPVTSWAEEENVYMEQPRAMKWSRKAANPRRMFGMMVRVLSVNGMADGEPGKGLLYF